MKCVSHRYLFSRARGYETALSGASHAHDSDEDGVNHRFLHACESEEFPGIFFELSTSNFCFFHHNEWRVKIIFGRSKVMEEQQSTPVEAVSQACISKGRPQVGHPSVAITAK